MPSAEAAASPASATLLVELLTEELPPRALKRLCAAFAKRWSRICGRTNS